MRNVSLTTVNVLTYVKTAVKNFDHQQNPQ